MSEHCRFFVRQPITTDQPLELDRATSAQIVNVLRLSAGSQVILFDGSGPEHTAKITSASASCVRAVPVLVSYPDTELQVSITAAIGRTKSAKMEIIIQKCTELGVRHFIVMECAHSIGSPPDQKKLLRWQKIAIEATEQCGGTVAPSICAGISAGELCSQISVENPAILANELEKRDQLTDILIDLHGSKHLIYITGPEGGFRQDEIDLFIGAGARSVSLGNRILRAETAAIACASALVLTANVH